MSLTEAREMALALMLSCPMSPARPPRVLRDERGPALPAARFDMVAEVCEVFLEAR